MSVVRVTPQRVSMSDGHDAYGAHTHLSGLRGHPRPWCHLGLSSRSGEGATATAVRICVEVACVPTRGHADARGACEGTGPAEP